MLVAALALFQKRQYTVFTLSSNRTSGTGQRLTFAFARVIWAAIPLF
jgi:hypothetical protein